jgi:hypothetical protein
MSRKLISIVSASLLAITLSGCGYDGHFRYPCQDPDNWESAECKPPICDAFGYCTTDLLGFDPTATESDTIEMVEAEEAETEIVELEETETEELENEE